MSTSTTELCSYLIGRLFVETSSVLPGIAAERDRLGERPFLVMVNQQYFDADGMTDGVFLLDSFATIPEAETFAERAKSDILSQQLKQKTFDGKHSWILESEGNAPYLGQVEGWLSKPKPTTLSALRQFSFKVRGGNYDSTYTIIIVVGPFSGPVIDQPLIDFIHNNSDLIDFFKKSGFNESGKHYFPKPV